MQWIKCSQTLPDEYRKVISYCENDFDKFKIDYLIKVENEFFWACRHLNEDRNLPTHWMPLIEPENYQ